MKKLTGKAPLVLFFITGLPLLVSCACQVNKSLSVNQPPSSTVAQSSPTVAISDEKGKERIHEGKYTNRGFGFSIQIPEGYKGIGGLPETPQHGITISLSGDDESKLSIDGSFNSLFLSSLDEVYKQELEYINQDAASPELREKKKVSLDGYPAIYFTVRHVDKKTGKAKITSQLISMRKCGGGDSEVIYTVRLDTPESRLREDTELMRRILDSWKMLEECG